MSAPLRLRVRNALGIKSADVTLKGLTLICGINGAGKTSLLQSAACAALGTAFTRGMKTKKAGAALLHEGAEAGAITLAYGAGEVRIDYPAATVTQKGVPEFLGTALGMGAVSFMSLDQSERMREIVERFDATPTRADLDAWLKANGLDLSDAAMDSLWGRIEDNSWDTVHSAAKTHGTKLRGRWEQITDQRWGSAKQAMWCPPEIDLSEGAPELARAKALAEIERQAYDDLLRRQAAAGADRDRLVADAAVLAEATLHVERLTSEGNALSEQLEELIQERGGTGNPQDHYAWPICPHCAKTLKVDRVSGSQQIVVTKAPPALTAIEREELKVRLQGLNQSIERTQEDINRNSRHLIEWKVKQTAAEAAKRELDRLAKVPSIAQADVDAANDKWRAADRMAKAVEAFLQAREIAADWQQNDKIVQAVAPGGVRHEVMTRRMSEFNAALSHKSQAAGFWEVSVTDEMEARYEGRPYVLLSESEQWRVNLVIACVLAEREKARLLIVDRLDVLHAGARPGVISMLHAMDRPALIGMTAKVLTDAPDLANPKLPGGAWGQRLWLERGALVEGAA